MPENASLRSYTFADFLDLGLAYDFSEPGNFHTEAIGGDCETVAAGSHIGSTGGGVKEHSSQ